MTSKKKQSGDEGEKREKDETSAFLHEGMRCHTRKKLKEKAKGWTEERGFSLGYLGGGQRAAKKSAARRSDQENALCIGNTVAGGDASRPDSLGSKERRRKIGRGRESPRIFGPPRAIRRKVSFKDAAEWTLTSNLCLRS